MADHPTPDTTPAPLPERFEHVERIERWWLRIGTVMLVAFVTIVFADALRNSAQHSGGAMAIEPSKLATTAPFDKPGVYPNEDGSYDAVVVSYAFGFLPKEDLVVPHGTPIHFKVASLDVVHGFQIPGRSNVNLEVLPGHVSEVTQTFDEPGRHLILCHEYCGSGHHFMVGHIRVLEPGVTPEQHAKEQAAAADAADDDAAAKETA